MLTCFQGCLSLGMVRLGFTQEKKKKKRLEGQFQVSLIS